MRRRDPLPLAAYARSIQLIYPKHLRDRYQDQMLQTARDANRERTYSALHFWAYLFSDLFRSSLQEHTRMFRNELLARPIFFHTIALAAIVTICGAGAALTCQQMLRRGANQPQVQMADQFVSELSSGHAPAEVMPSRRVDLRDSLEPFAIFYNEAGVPVASSGTLNGAVPTPPAGVFDYLRQHSSDTITWQPQHGVRIAAVLRPVRGLNPGYILTGRSLRLVEEQESIFWRMAFSVWIGLLGVLACGAVLLSRAQSPSASPMATQA
jgi:hypothetical protein